MSNKINYPEHPIPGEHSIPCGKCGKPMLCTDVSTTGANELLQRICRTSVHRCTSIICGNQMRVIEERYRQGAWNVTRITNDHQVNQASTPQQGQQASGTKYKSTMTLQEIIASNATTPHRVMTGTSEAVAPFTQPTPPPPPTKPVVKPPDEQGPGRAKRQVNI